MQQVARCGDAKHDSSGECVPLMTADCTDVCMPTLNAPNVEIERKAKAQLLAFRSNAGLGETMPRMQCFGKRQRDEQQASVR